MNGYTPPHPAAVFAAYNSPLNGQTLPRSPERQHKAKPKSSAKAIYDQRKHFTKTSINSLTDTSQYHVEHLTTFVLDRKDGMVTIEDGIRKLRLLDAKGKVWTQDMLLQVEDKAVSLHDLETKKELENFPMATLQLCQAVMNSCSYDSILALVCKEPGQNRADLHLFHCQDIKANLIQADIESAMLDARGGKMKRRPDALKMILKSDGVIPPPPAAPAPSPPPSSVGGVGGGDVKGRVAAWSAWASEQQDYNDQRPYAEEGVCPEMIAARVDRDVQILNHILDDIEFLVTCLQKAAEAYHQLTRRKKTKKGKKKSPGEGVLTLRSRPPGEDEFVDCLQKFKHAFNLLAKLSDHIQNPSALDLVHFLFTPLRMVIQTSSVELARSVVVPLLNRETLHFLQNSLTAEEKHVWTALSDGWTRCRSEWPAEQFFPTVALRFRDGWEPPVLAFLGPSREQEMSRIAQTIQNHTEVQRAPGERLTNQNHPSTDGYHQSPEGYLPSPDGYHQSADGYHQSADGYHQSADGYHPSTDGYHQSADSYQALPSGAERGQRSDVRGQLKPFVAKSKYDFVARNNTELSVLKDELVEVVDDRKQWWKVRNGGGASGYVPNNILEVTRSANQNDAGAEPVYSHTIQKQTIKPAATAMPPSSMPSATHHPHHHPPMPPVAPMLPPPAPAPPSSAARLPSPPLPPPGTASEPPPHPYPPVGTVGVGGRHNNGNAPPPGGDPGANVTMREQRPANQRHAPVNRRKSNMEEVQDELMTRLTLGRSAQKKISHQVHSGPAAGGPAPGGAGVTYDSAPREVRAWLEAKGFSPVTITSLGVLTGAQLFSLNKEELKTVCPDDGARVFSQVTVQKAALERSSGNELLEIMRRRQEKLSAVAADSGVESFDEGSTH